MKAIPLETRYKVTLGWATNHACTNNLVVVVISGLALPILKKAVKGDPLTDFTGKQGCVEAVGQNSLLNVAVRVFNKLQAYKEHRRLRCRCHHNNAHNYYAHLHNC
jgi:hypothetical protein